jgi:hypothetical protein
VIKEQPLVLVKPATPVCCFADAWQSRGGDTRLRHLRYGLLHQARRKLVNSGTLPFRIPARSLRYTEEKKNAPNGIYGTSRNA